MSSAESALLREWCTRVVHEGSAQEYVAVHEITEWCTRVRSGAQDYGAVHEYRVVHKNE